ncbi:MAG: ABC transporter permease, partial [Mesorhizobium sp.]
MTVYLLKRLAVALITLVLASMVVFVVLEIIPG